MGAFVILPIVGFLFCIGIVYVICSIALFTIRITTKRLKHPKVIWVLVGLLMLVGVAFTLPAILLGGLILNPAVN